MLTECACMDIKYSEWFKEFMTNNYQEIPLKFKIN
jgi:hypothetical protein